MIFDANSGDGPFHERVEGNAICNYEVETEEDENYLENSLVTLQCLDKCIRSRATVSKLISSITCVKD